MGGVRPAGRISAELWSKLHCYNPWFRRMVDTKIRFAPLRRPAVHYQAELSMGKNFKIGDHVSWNSEAGRVSGMIVRVHRRKFGVNGYTHHASAEAPQYEIKSSKTEHVAFHKGSALTKLRD
jgi:hypothetical protein